MARERPGAMVITKRPSSAFAGTGPAGHLATEGFGCLVVVDAAFDFCVGSAVRSARDAGQEVWLVPDAISGFGFVLGPEQALDPGTVLRLNLGTLGAGFAQRVPADQLASRITLATASS